MDKLHAILVYQLPASQCAIQNARIHKEQNGVSYEIVHLTLGILKSQISCLHCGSFIKGSYNTHFGELNLHLFTETHSLSNLKNRGVSNATYL